MSDHCDCPPCPACALPTGCPILARRPFYPDADPRVLRCAACGHVWLELDLDACARAWRAECADHARLLAEDAARLAT